MRRSRSEALRHASSAAAEREAQPGGVRAESPKVSYSPWYAQAHVVVPVVLGLGLGVTLVAPPCGAEFEHREVARHVHVALVSRHHTVQPPLHHAFAPQHILNAPLHAMPRPGRYIARADFGLAQRASARALK